MAVKMVKETSMQNFVSDLYASREPCVLKGVDLGPAPSLWTAEYLADRCGEQREVKVHVCPHRHMDFINKNFLYK